ncbi:carcinoembryonic antigen-related cell adhesion molecule 3-like isoform X2 [Lepisosteus oculatus]|uniref:carcinoembryonic antigen-related cell adhesion molecule 3-like isoform X2 n=1 Tax=Lepisosteus oculatus TaxID=7918 RepID=UPI0035F52D94
MNLYLCVFGVYCWTFSRFLTEANEETHVKTGSSIFLHLNRRGNMSTDDYTLKKDDKLVVKYKSSLPQYYGTYTRRSQFYPNMTLRIDGAMESDSGNYLLEIYNNGKFVHRETYCIVVTVPPVYGILYGSVFLYLRKGNHLRSSGVVWKKNGLEVASLKNSEVRLHEAYNGRAELFPDGTLRLDRTEAMDEGTYTLEQTDGMGHRESYRLFLLENSKFDSVDGEEGSSVFLHVQQVRLPSNIHITWKREDNLLATLKDHDYYTFNRTGIVLFPNGTLRLDNAQEPDTGPYSWDILDVEKKHTHHGVVQLFVIYNEQRPPVYGSLGRSVSLSLVNGRGENVYDVKWMKGDISVAQFKTAFPSYNGNYKNRLKIFSNGTMIMDRIQENDSGVYSVDFFYKNGTKHKIVFKLYINDSTPLDKNIHTVCNPDGKIDYFCLVQEGECRGDQCKLVK